MRTIGFRSQIVFVIAAAAGLLAALGRPWYAPAFVARAEEARIGEVHGPVEGFFARLGRELTESDGVTGWATLTTGDLVLTSLAALSVVSALLTLVPAIEQPAREILRIAALAMLGVVVVKLVNVPENMPERRQGVWIALGVTGIMVSSAMTICAAPLTRRRRGPSLTEVTPAPPVPALDTSSSSGPPGRR